MMRTQQIIHFFVLSSLLLGACQSKSPTAAPVTASPIPTSTPTVPPPTPVPPVVYLGGSVPCFAGPTVDRNIVSIVDVGDHPEILGADDTGRYWITEPQEGKYCWIEAQYVTVVGDVGEMTVIIPTPTAIPPVPSAPRNPTSEVKCQVYEWPYEVQIFLNWEDLEGETGYRVYRDGSLLAELGPNEAHYVDTLTRDDGWGRNKSMLIPYQIEAFNMTGTSEPAEVPVAFLCRL